MSRANIQFPLIRNAALTFMFTLVSCTAIYGICYYYKTLWQQRQDDLGNIITQLNYDITDRYVNLGIYNEYKDRYTDINAAGYTDFGHRIDWIERMEQSAAKLRLSQLDYKIDPTVQSDTHVDNISAITIHETPISITTSVAHEGDVVTLYNDLVSTKGMGVLDSNNCALSRGSDKSRKGFDNLQLNCQFVRFSATANSLTSDNDALLASELDS